MSFFRCCIGGEPRDPNEPVLGPNGSHPRGKTRKQTEMFFDDAKPEGQLSSVTELANSTDKRRKESREKEPSRPPPPPKKPGDANPVPQVPDNNGLSRGQNFMKVEKWLREAQKSDQVSVAPGDIANLEDHQPGSRDGDIPSEKDRLPHAHSPGHANRR